MDEPAILAFLQNPDWDALRELLANDAATFLVDWRETDNAIVEDCEAILQTDSLSAELVKVQTKDEYEIYINYLNRRMQVPLNNDTSDRHALLCALNDILAPDFEVRWIVLSRGTDTLGVVSLSTDAWRSLERLYPQAVAENFLDPRGLPNLSTDFADDDFPQPAKAHWQRMLETAPRDPLKPSGDGTTVGQVKTESNHHSTLAKIVLGAATAILIALFAASREHRRDKNVPQPKEVKALEDQAQKDIREGRASDTVLIIYGIDPKKYRKQHPKPPQPEDAHEPSE